jgi:hypothetical protein
MMFPWWDSVAFRGSSEQILSTEQTVAAHFPASAHLRNVPEHFTTVEVASVKVYFRDERLELRPMAQPETTARRRLGTGASPA